MRDLYFLLVALVISVTGCASAVTGRNDAPDLSFTTQKSLLKTANCVNSFMSQNNPLGYPFYLRTIEVDHVYEAHPGRDIMLGGEPVFVRIETTDSYVVKVEGYSVRNFDRWFKGLQQACA